MSSAAQAFIAFLRCEATQSDERARSLRATAAAIEANNLEGACRSSGVHLLFCVSSWKIQPHFFGIFLIGRKKKRKRDAVTKPRDQLANPATGHHTAASELEEVELPEPPNADDGVGKKGAIGKKEVEKGLLSVSI
jgi:hypothetical protein